MFEHVIEFVAYYWWVWLLVCGVCVVISVVALLWHIMITEVVDDDSEFDAQPKRSWSLIAVSLFFLVLGGLSLATLISPSIIWIAKLV